MMKKLLPLALIAVAASSQALVFPAPSFPTPPFWKETFDTAATPAGAYASLPLFSGWGNMNKIGVNGALVIRPLTGPPSVPNVLYGDGVDVQIGAVVPMRRFGGWYRQVPFSSPSTTVTFRFLDASLTPIGTVTVPLTPTWQFHAWQTFPKWSRVEITGNIPGFRGGVAMDTLTMRPW